MFRLSLKYPNGRSHHLDYEGPRRFRVGSEFEMFGRRWRVNDIRAPKTRLGESGRVVTCEPLTQSPSTQHVDYDQLVHDLAAINDLLERTKTSRSAAMQETRQDLERTRTRMLELLAAYGPPSSS